MNKGNLGMVTKDTYTKTENKNIDRKKLRKLRYLSKDDAAAWLKPFHKYKSYFKLNDS